MGAKVICQRCGKHIRNDPKFGDTAILLSLCDACGKRKPDPPKNGMKIVPEEVQ